MVVSLNQIILIKLQAVPFNINLILSTKKINQIISILKNTKTVKKSNQEINEIIEVRDWSSFTRLYKASLNMEVLS